MNEITLPTPDHQPTIACFEFEWQGITINVTHKPAEYASDSFCFDHIELRADQHLPVTDTGYRSYFVSSDDILEAGGIMSFLQDWFCTEASSKDWQDYQVSRLQSSLF